MIDLYNNKIINRYSNVSNAIMRIYTSCMCTHTNTHMYMHMHTHMHVCMCMHTLSDKVHYLAS